MNAVQRLLVLSVLLAGCAPPEQASPSVTDAWVRAAPPTAGMTAGYMTVTNPGNRPVLLTAVSSAAFDRIELHTTIMEDGIAKMREEDQVAIPAGGTVSFEPGGRHLMMFGATRPLSEGDAIALVVTFDGPEGAASQARVEVEAPVRRGVSSHEHHH